MIDPGAKKVSMACAEHWHPRCVGHLGVAAFKCQCDCHNPIAATVRELIHENLGEMLEGHREKK